MRNYLIAPRALEPQHVDDYYWAGDRRSIDVFEQDGGRFTGLLDARGNKIFVSVGLGPIGFGKE